MPHVSLLTGLLGSVMRTGLSSSPQMSRPKLSLPLSVSLVPGQQALGAGPVLGAGAPGTCGLPVPTHTGPGRPLAGVGAGRSAVPAHDRKEGHRQSCGHNPAAGLLRAGSRSVF